MIEYFKCILRTGIASVLATTINREAAAAEFFNRKTKTMTYTWMSVTARKLATNAITITTAATAAAAGAAI